MMRLVYIIYYCECPSYTIVIYESIPQSHTTTVLILIWKSGNNRPLFARWIAGNTTVFWDQLQKVRRMVTTFLLYNSFWNKKVDQLLSSVLSWTFYLWLSCYLHIDNMICVKQYIPSAWPGWMVVMVWYLFGSWTSANTVMMVGQQMSGVIYCKRTAIAFWYCLIERV